MAKDIDNLFDQSTKALQNTERLLSEAKEAAANNPAASAEPSAPEAPAKPASVAPEVPVDPDSLDPKELEIQNLRRELENERIKREEEIKAFTAAKLIDDMPEWKKIAINTFKNKGGYKFEDAYKTIEMHGMQDFFNRIPSDKITKENIAAIMSETILEQSKFMEQKAQQAAQERSDHLDKYWGSANRDDIEKRLISDLKAQGLPERIVHLLEAEEMLAFARKKIGLSEIVKNSDDRNRERAIAEDMEAKLANLRANFGLKH